MFEGNILGAAQDRNLTSQARPVTYPSTAWSYGVDNAEGDTPKSAAARILPAAAILTAALIINWWVFKKD